MACWGPRRVWAHLLLQQQIWPRPAAVAAQQWQQQQCLLHGWRGLLHGWGLTVPAAQHAAAAFAAAAAVAAAVLL
jgi:hypothetical protein